jgi:hypothetical protein
MEPVEGQESLVVEVEEGKGRQHRQSTGPLRNDVKKRVRALVPANLQVRWGGGVCVWGWCVCVCVCVCVCGVCGPLGAWLATCPACMHSIVEGACLACGSCTPAVCMYACGASG